MGSPPPLNLIEVSASAQERIRADRADVLATLEGTTLLLGNAVVSQAKEVKELIDQLVPHGILAEHVELEGVETSVVGKWVGKSSLARYQLRIRVMDLTRMGEVLQTLSGLKNAKVTELVWKYSEESAAQARVLGRAVAQAKAKALEVAQALGVALGLAHRVQENGVFSPVTPRGMSAPMAAPPLEGAASEVMELQAIHTREIRVNVQVHFHIGAPLPAPLS